MADKLAEKKKEQPTLRDLLESDSFRDAVKRSLPTHLKPDRFIRIAVTTMIRTPKLAECDQASFFNALLSLSQLGLEPDGRRAHLIPFMNRKRNPPNGVMECQLIIDYKGLVELAMRNPDVANIHAELVKENDVFIYDRGMIVKHEIDFKKPRGKMYAVWCIVRFKDGSEKAEVMTKEDVDDIRKRSKASANGPWVTDYDEMAKKTVARRNLKWIPMTEEYRDAMELDDGTLSLPASAAEPQKFIKGDDSVGSILANNPAPAEESETDEPAPVKTEKASAADAFAPDEKRDANPPSVGKAVQKEEGLGSDGGETMREPGEDGATGNEPPENYQKEQKAPPPEKQPEVTPANITDKTKFAAVLLDKFGSLAAIARWLRETTKSAKYAGISTLDQVKTVAQLSALKMAFERQYGAKPVANGKKK